VLTGTWPSVCGFAVQLVRGTLLRYGPRVQPDGFSMCSSDLGQAAALNPLLIAIAPGVCSDKERAAVTAINFSVTKSHSGTGDPPICDQHGTTDASEQARGDLP